jgi:hypothetical protein
LVHNQITHGKIVVYVGRTPPPNEIDFILRELRTPEILIEAVTRFPEASQNIARVRPAVKAALSGEQFRHQR